MGRRGGGRCLGRVRHRVACVEPAASQKDADGNPVSNGARNIWVTETSLSTALNTSFLAESTALFGIVVAVALILAGVGFIILALGGALRRSQAGD